MATCWRLGVTRCVAVTASGVEATMALGSPILTSNASTLGGTKQTARNASASITLVWTCTSSDIAGSATATTMHGDFTHGKAICPREKRFVRCCAFWATVSSRWAVVVSARNPTIDNVGGQWSVVIRHGQVDMCQWGGGSLTLFPQR